MNWSCTWNIGQTFQHMISSKNYGNILFKIISFLEVSKTHFPLAHILPARANNCSSAVYDSNRAVCKNLVKISIKSRWISGNPNLHICFSRSLDALISPWVGFGEGEWLKSNGVRIRINVSSSSYDVWADSYESSSVSVSRWWDSVTAPFRWFENGTNWWRS